MMHRTGLMLLMAAAVMIASAAGIAQQEPAKAPTTVKEVMTTLTIPASDVIFAAASELPQNDEQWAALRQGAQTLAASGRLLMTVHLARDTTTWMEMSRALVSQAEATLKIAGAKKGEALEQASNDVYTTCETCHTRYLEPANEPEPSRPR